MRGKRPDHSAGRTNAPCGLPGAPRGDSRPCEMSAHRDEAAERRRGVTDEFVESPGGISPPGAPRSMHEPLDSHGSRCSAASMAQLPMSEERRICAAKPIKPVACSFGLATQPLEFAARPADDIEINPLQGRTQLRSVEVAVVVDPALNARVVHLGQIWQGFVAAMMKRPAPDRPTDERQRLRAGGG